MPNAVNDIKYSSVFVETGYCHVSTMMMFNATIYLQINRLQCRRQPYGDTCTNMCNFHHGLRHACTAMCSGIR
jgi:hypothetical protein